jgi:hypothetical protein
VLGGPRHVTPPWSGEPHDHPVPGVDHLEVIDAEVLPGETTAHGAEYLVAIVADEVIVDALMDDVGIKAGRDALQVTPSHRVQVIEDRLEIRRAHPCASHKPLPSVARPESGRGHPSQRPRRARRAGAVGWTIMEA